MPKRPGEMEGFRPPDEPPASESGRGARESKASLESPELRERTRELAKELETQLNDRFREFGRSETVSIAPPELPAGLTEKHLDAVRKALGGGRGFEERVLPRLEDLRNLDEAYVDVMYPEQRNEADEARGLTTERDSSWFGRPGRFFGEDPISSNITEGEEFISSMRRELAAIGGSLVLLDTARKPHRSPGVRYYGTRDGIDPSADPLSSLFQEAFGKDRYDRLSGRNGHAWHELEDDLLPLAKKKIADSFRAEGLADVDFDVILVPATLVNLEMTLYHPESSTTDSWEWTSTPIIDETGTDTGGHIMAGAADRGGASALSNPPFAYFGRPGARLAVVWKKRD